MSSLNRAKRIITTWLVVSSFVFVVATGLYIEKVNSAPEESAASACSNPENPGVTTLQGCIDACNAGGFGDCESVCPSWCQVGVGGNQGGSQSGGQQGGEPGHRRNACSTPGGYCCGTEGWFTHEELAGRTCDQFLDEEFNIRPCYETGTCPGCTEDRCTGTLLQRCVNGVYQSQRSFGSAEECNAAKTGTQIQGSTQSCGNNVVEGTEVCDDGNTNNGDSCNANCTAIIIQGNPNENTYNSPEPTTAGQGLLLQEEPVINSPNNLDADLVNQLEDQIRIFESCPSDVTLAESWFNAVGANGELCGLTFPGLISCNSTQKVYAQKCESNSGADPRYINLQCIEDTSYCELETSSRVCPSGYSLDSLDKKGISCGVNIGSVNCRPNEQVYAYECINSTDDVREYVEWECRDAPDICSTAGDTNSVVFDSASVASNSNPREPVAVNILPTSNPSSCDQLNLANADYFCLGTSGESCTFNEATESYTFEENNPACTPSLDTDALTTFNFIFNSPQCLGEDITDGPCILPGIACVVNDMGGLTAQSDPECTVEEINYTGEGNCLGRSFGECISNTEICADEDNDFILEPTPDSSCNQEFGQVAIPEICRDGVSNIQLRYTGEESPYLTVGCILLEDETYNGQYCADTIINDSRQAGQDGVFDEAGFNAAYCPPLSSEDLVTDRLAEEVCNLNDTNTSNGECPLYNNLCSRRNLGDCIGNNLICTDDDEDGVLEAQPDSGGICANIFEQSVSGNCEEEFISATFVDTLSNNPYVCILDSNGNATGEACLNTDYDAQFDEYRPAYFPCIANANTSNDLAAASVPESGELTFCDTSTYYMGELNNYCLGNGNRGQLNGLKCQWDEDNFSYSVTCDNASCSIFPGGLSQVCENNSGEIEINSEVQAKCYNNQRPLASANNTNCVTTQFNTYAGESCFDDNSDGIFDRVGPNVECNSFGSLPNSELDSLTTLAISQLNSLISSTYSNISSFSFPVSSSLDFDLIPAQGQTGQQTQTALVSIYNRIFARGEIVPTVIIDEDANYEYDVLIEMANTAITSRDIDLALNRNVCLADFDNSSTVDIVDLDILSKDLLISNSFLSKFNSQAAKRLYLLEVFATDYSKNRSDCSFYSRVTIPQ